MYTLLTRSNSLAGRHHSWQRRWPGHFGHLLQVDITTTAKDLHPVLGLLTAFGGGTPDHHQQVQYVLADGADGRDDNGPCAAFGY